MFETSDDVHLARQELLEEFFGRQVVVDNLDGEVSPSRQVHCFLDDRERSFTELVSETISVLQEHHLQVDRALHVCHRRLSPASPRGMPRNLSLSPAYHVTSLRQTFQLQWRQSCVSPTCSLEKDWRRRDCSDTGHNPRARQEPVFLLQNRIDSVRLDKFAPLALLPKILLNTSSAMLDDAAKIFRFFGVVCIHAVTSRGFKCSAVTRMLGRWWQWFAAEMSCCKHTTTPHHDDDQLLKWKIWGDGTLHQLWAPTGDCGPERFYEIWGVETLDLNNRRLRFDLLMCYNIIYNRVKLSISIGIVFFFTFATYPGKVIPLN